MKLLCRQNTAFSTYRDSLLNNKILADYNFVAEEKANAFQIVEGKFFSFSLTNYESFIGMSHNSFLYQEIVKDKIKKSFFQAFGPLFEQNEMLLAKSMMNPHLKRSMENSGLTYSNNPLDMLMDFDKQSRNITNSVIALE
jgi:hypothetical protein